MLYEFVNDGSGGFGAPPVTQTGFPQKQGLVAGDWNSDGDTDIGVVDTDLVLFDNAAGTLTRQAQVVEVPSGARRAAARRCSATSTATGTPISSYPSRWSEVVRR